MQIKREANVGQFSRDQDSRVVTSFTHNSSTWSLPSASYEKFRDSRFHSSRVSYKTSTLLNLLGFAEFLII
jgi:hypothetical protein